MQEYYGISSVQRYILKKDSGINYLMAGRFLNHAPGKRKAMRNANHNFSSISLVLSFLRTHLLLLLLVIQILCNSVGSASTTETTATGFKLNPVIVVIAFDRSSQLRHTLRSIAEASPPNFSIPIYVSVDDNPKAYRYVNNVRIYRNFNSLPKPNLWISCMTSERR